MNGAAKGMMTSEAVLPSDFMVRRVLLLDDDQDHLYVVANMLLECQYEVKYCSQIESALEKLKEEKGKFDVLLSNCTALQPVGAIKLLQNISEEFDVPVFIMSSDDKTTIAIAENAEHGFFGYLVKPITKEMLMNILPDVERKRKHTMKEENFDNCKACHQLQNSEKKNDPKNLKMKNHNDRIQKDVIRGIKKPRVIWNKHLHTLFVSAVMQLGGPNKAVPKRIMELMNVPGITRENIASHLQKYRQNCSKKNAQELKEKGFGPMPFTNSPDLRGPVNWITEWQLQRQRVMNHQDWYESLHASQNINTHVQMVPPFQPMEPMMPVDVGSPMNSNGVAQPFFPNGGGAIEMGREEIYNPILHTPSIDFPISNCPEYQLGGLPPVNDFYPHFPQVGRQDWVQNFHHGNIVPDQPHKDMPMLPAGFSLQDLISAFPDQINSPGDAGVYTHGHELCFGGFPADKRA